MIIGLPVLEKKIFEGFYHILAWQPSWSLTRIMLTNFHFLVPEGFHKKIVQNSPVVSEKIWFEFLYVQDLEPRSRNDLDL